MTILKKKEESEIQTIRCKQVKSEEKKPLIDFGRYSSYKQAIWVVRNK